VDIVVLFTALSKMVAVYGPSSLGWVVSAILSYSILKRKKEESEEIKDMQEKLLEAKDDYIDKAHNMNDNLIKLNEKHAEIVSHLSEERISDLKELTTEYNSLATSMAQTLDRLTIALEVRRNDKKR